MFRYKIYLPSKVNVKSYPLLIYFHGFGLFESFQATPLSFVDKIKELNNFIIATPFSESKTSWWNHSELFE